MHEKIHYLLTNIGHYIYALFRGTGVARTHESYGADRILYGRWLNLLRICGADAR